MKSTGIAEAAEALAEILREHMVPKTVGSREKIGLCSPSEKGDCSVGIWLYDIRECDELKSHAMVTVDSVRQRYPSHFVNLMFVITAYAGGEPAYRVREELGILGRILQVLGDHSVPEGFSSCQVVLQNLSMEEKTRIFNVPNMSYRTSLFYEMGPIEIESEKERQTARVVELEFGVSEKE